MQIGSSNGSSRTRTKAKAVSGKTTKRTKADPNTDTLHLKAKHLIGAPVDPTIDIASMIATAAYFRASQRGFAPGHELDDWLQAEQLVRSQVPS